MNIKLGSKVFVVDWGKHYSDITKWNSEKRIRENCFPIKTKIPDYSGIDFHWEWHYKPNLTRKGEVNKREPQKLVGKTPKYKHYKWEVIEIFKHPKAGEYCHSKEVREHWGKDDESSVFNSKYTENNLLLLASTHTDKEWMKCYIVIEETGVSNLTPEQYANDQFNDFIEANLRVWDRNKINRENQKNIPKEIISVFYDKNDNVLFGNRTVKGLVSYSYLDGKFSKDGKPIYLFSSVSYDGKGNKGLSDKDKDLVKPFLYIENYLQT